MHGSITAFPVLELLLLETMRYCTEKPAGVLPLLGLSVQPEGARASRLAGAPVLLVWALYCRLLTAAALPTHGLAMHMYMKKSSLRLQRPALH